MQESFGKEPSVLPEVKPIDSRKSVQQRYQSDEETADYMRWLEDSITLEGKLDLERLSEILHWKDSKKAAKQEAKKQGEKGPVKVGRVGQQISIDDQLKANLLNAKTNEEVAQAQAEIYEQVRSQMPTSLAEQIRATQYFFMLSWPTTHLTNIGGNVFSNVLRKIDEKTAIVMERMLPKDERTKSTKLLYTKIQRGQEVCGG